MRTTDNRKDKKMTQRRYEMSEAEMERHCRHLLGTAVHDPESAISRLAMIGTILVDAGQEEVIHDLCKKITRLAEARPDLGIVYVYYDEDRGITIWYADMEERTVWFPLEKVLKERSEEDINALPDYVLNPHRPEYN